MKQINEMCPHCDAVQEFNVPDNATFLICPECGGVVHFCDECMYNNDDSCNPANPCSYCYENKEELNMKTRYYVCGLGYDENDDVTDYEWTFDGFDTYVEAYELFVKLQCKDASSFFEDTSGVGKLLIQLEECEETDWEINCVDVKNEWWIVNPNFKEV